MVDRREEPHDIGAEAVTVAADPAVRARHGDVSPLSLPAGVRIADEPSLEERLEDAHDGVVNDAIPERSGGDETPLRLQHVERPVRAGTVGPGPELVVKPPQLPLALVVERDRRGRVARSPAGEPVRTDEIPEAADLREEIAALRSDLARLIEDLRG